MKFVTKKDEKELTRLKFHTIISGMKSKISHQKNSYEVKAIKALLSAEDVERSKRIADERGMKLQAFYGIAIRKATEEATRGTCN